MIYVDIHTHQHTTIAEEVMMVGRAVGVYRSYGIHPWHIADLQKQLAELRILLCRVDVVVIGEAGFDKLAQAPLIMQQEAFIAQARIAEELGKPMIVHCVKAWDELIAARKIIRPSLPWIIHGFRGNGLLARQLLGQGLLLSFGMQYNEEALRAAWPESLFAETDNNEIDIRTVYARMAASLDMPIAQLAQQIVANSLRVFPALSSALTNVPSNNYQLSILSFQL